VVPRLAVRLAVALLCATGVAVSVTSRDSRTATEKAYGYWFDTHDSRGTLERIHRARRLNPSYQLDILAAGVVPPSKGKPLLQSALRREPENAELWKAMSVVQAGLGDLAASKRAYYRAVALAPHFLNPGRVPRR
jgi:Tfp pilus assembly protein PilF